MVDLAFGPEPGKRPDLSDPHQSYIAMTRQKRLYGGILLVVLLVVPPELEATALEWAAEVNGKSPTAQRMLNRLVQDMLENAEETIAEHPVATVAGALALGIVIGRLTAH